VLLWILYFDNLPSHEHSSTWQQGWAILHLPLHLSFVGILEGSRQVAMMRFISQALHGFVAKADKYCLRQHLDGKVLGEKLLRLVDNYDFGVLHPTADQYIRMRNIIDEIEEIPGICSIQNTANVTTVFHLGSPIFPRFNELLYHFATALFISDGAEEILPAATELDAFALLQRSVTTIYLYYWSSVLVMLLTLIALYCLSNHKSYRHYDVADYCSTGVRAIMAIMAAGLVALYADKVAWQDSIASRAMLPTLGGVLTLVVVGDAVGRRLRARGMRKRLKVSPVQVQGDTCASEQEQSISRWEIGVNPQRHNVIGPHRGAMIIPRASVYHWLIPAVESHGEYSIQHRGDGRPF
jgi:hypothetical protein